MDNKEQIIVGPEYKLTVEDVFNIANNSAIQIILSETAKKNILRSRKVVEDIVKDRRVAYGVTTGFGSFKDKFIPEQDCLDLQKNLIRSHSAGVGQLLSVEAVRAALFVRVNSLIQGYSGIRLEFVEAIIGLLNKNVTPVVPSQGSVGSSGDLAPLSHMGLVLMGEGEAYFNGQRLSGAEALAQAGLKPIEFREKEGLAFNNGTSVMTGIAAVTLHRAKQLLDLADLSCAMTLEGVCGLRGAFDERVHNLRPYAGQKKSASNIRKFIEESQLVNMYPERVQDSYSIRCTPQVHGAIREAITYVDNTVNCEINSTTDNPLIFFDQNEAISAGNFHGEPIAIAMDTLGIALAELANIAERRIAKLIDPSTNGGLPIFLIDKDKGGLHNGFMIPQYVAASLVSENKVLAHPASVDSIPTSVNQEDHVSMGTIAARKAANILENTENVIAIELMIAAQAIDFRDVTKLGKVTKRAHVLIRQYISHLDNDRILSTDIKKIKNLIEQFAFQSIVA